MPQLFDDPYNDRLQEAYSSVREQLAKLQGEMQELTARYIEVVAQSDGYDDTERRLDEGADELKASAAAAITAAQSRGKQTMETAHARGYEDAKEAAEQSSSVPPSVVQALPDFSPSTSVDPSERAPFSDTAQAYVRSSIDESISYAKQDLRFIRKYVREDRYANAVANVLASGDEEIKAAMRSRGIDLDDIDTDDLKERAADVFTQTKTRGDSRIRGLLKELEPGEVAERDPQLWQRVKRNGTDSLPRILDEAAKDLAADSPAIELVSWELSSRHDSLPSSPDSCDYLATQNLYDFGPGIYHPKSVPSHPHSNCECEITVVTKDPSDWGKQTKERPDAFDVQEDEIRDELASMRGQRSITDAHVRRVRKEIETVIEQVHSNERT